MAPRDRGTEGKSALEETSKTWGSDSYGLRPGLPLSSPGLEGSVKGLIPAQGLSFSPSPQNLRTGGCPFTPHPRSSRESSVLVVCPVTPTTSHSLKTGTMGEKHTPKTQSWKRGVQWQALTYFPLFQVGKIIIVHPHPASCLPQFSSVQSLSRVWLFATPWIAARQASLSITNSRSSPKLMCIELVMPSCHLILCCPLLFLPSIFPSIRVFSNESALRIRWPSIGASASASVLPMNTQDWSPSEWNGWTSLQSKGLARVFSNTTVQKHQFFSAQLSSQTEHMNGQIQAYLIVLLFAVLCFVDNCVCFTNLMFVITLYWALSKFIGTIFLMAFPHFVSLHHILVILAMFQIFHQQ